MTVAAPPALPLDRLITLLADYEQARVGDPVRFNKFRVLQTAFPQLDFPTRAEPRTTVRKQLEAVQASDVVAFKKEILHLFGDPGIPLNSLAVLVSLLAEGQFDFPVATLFRAIKRIAQADDDDLVDQIAADIVSLAEVCDPGDLFAVLHRLAEQRIARPAALFAALHVVARNYAGKLEAIFTEFRNWIADPTCNVEALAVWLTEVSRNAGRESFLHAIRQLSPTENGKLLVATFGTTYSPLEITQTFEDDPDLQRLSLTWQGDPVPLEFGETAEKRDQWLTEISMAMGKAAWRLPMDDGETSLPRRMRGRPNHTIPATLDDSRARAVLKQLDQMDAPRVREAA